MHTISFGTVKAVDDQFLELGATYIFREYAHDRKGRYYFIKKPGQHCGMEITPHDFNLCFKMIERSNILEAFDEETGFKGNNGGVIFYNQSDKFDEAAFISRIKRKYSFTLREHEIAALIDVLLRIRKNEPGLADLGCMRENLVSL